MQHAARLGIFRVQGAQGRRLRPPVWQFAGSRTREGIRQSTPGRKGSFSEKPFVISSLLGYGGKPGLLRAPSGRGQRFVGEVPRNCTGWVKPPKDWAEWQSWSPQQKAAYRAYVENKNPGGWGQESYRLQQMFTPQGASADVTPLQASGADTSTLAGDVMNANVLGQPSGTGWLNQQQKNWSRSRAPAVKQTAGIAA